MTVSQDVATTIFVAVFAAIASPRATMQKIEDYPPPFPRSGTIKLRDTARFTAWDVLREKGKPSPLYKLDMDQVSVTMTEGAVRITSADDSISIDNSRIGTVTFESKDTIRREEGLSDVPSRTIVVQLKSAPPDNVPIVLRGPGLLPRRDAFKLFETERICVWEQTWLPNRPFTNCGGYLEVASVFITGGKLRRRSLGSATDETGSQVFEQYVGLSSSQDPGGPDYPNAPITFPYEEEWVSGEPRAIWIEFKYGK